MRICIHFNRLFISVVTCRYSSYTQASMCEDAERFETLGWPDGIVTHEYPRLLTFPLSPLQLTLLLFFSVGVLTLFFFSRVHLDSPKFFWCFKPDLSCFSILFVCPPVRLPVCLPLVVYLAVNASDVIGICRSARDLIQRGVLAGCLEIDLASEIWRRIKSAISVLSATLDRFATELLESFSITKWLFAFIFISHIELHMPHSWCGYLCFGIKATFSGFMNHSVMNQCRSLSKFMLHNLILIHLLSSSEIKGRM